MLLKRMQRVPSFNNIQPSTFATRLSHTRDKDVCDDKGVSQLMQVQAYEDLLKTAIKWHVASQHLDHTLL